MSRADQQITIEPGGLDALDRDRVLDVLVVLRENADKTRRMAAMHGATYLEDIRRRYYASADVHALTAIRYARLTLAYSDALLWIMASTAVTEYALAASIPPDRRTDPQPAVNPAPEENRTP